MVDHVEIVEIQRQMKESGRILENQVLRSGPDQGGLQCGELGAP